MTASCRTSWCFKSAGHGGVCEQPTHSGPPSLFDEPTGDELKAQAMVEVDANALPSWKEEVDLAIRSLVQLGHPFTTDDVWELLNVLQTDKTHEPRAMGPAMLRASRAGLIRPTERYRNSVRPETHSNPKRIWEPRRAGGS